MFSEIHPSWEAVLKDEFSKPYFLKLVDFVKNDYENFTCYPNINEVFKAFNVTPLEKVKVVILGQDPYINSNQAHGLCFSVRNNSAPPSLKNILKELKDDIGTSVLSGTDLTFWAEQGVLLLNDTLTVRAGESNSHAKKGWSKFTSEAIRQLNLRKKNIVYILWGAAAKKKASSVSRDDNCLIESVHPSPLSAYRGFYGSKPFSRANEYLRLTNQKPISW